MLGKLYTASPDLVHRFAENAPLNALMGAETFYGGGAHGYTDYPTLDESHDQIERSTQGAV